MLASLTVFLNVIKGLIRIKCFRSAPAKQRLSDALCMSVKLFSDEPLGHFLRFGASRQMCVFVLCTLLRLHWKAPHNAQCCSHKWIHWHIQMHIINAKTLTQWSPVWIMKSCVGSLTSLTSIERSKGLSACQTSTTTGNRF